MSSGLCPAGPSGSVQLTTRDRGNADEARRKRRKSGCAPLSEVVLMQYATRPSHPGSLLSDPSEQGSAWERRVRVVD